MHRALRLAKTASRCSSRPSGDHTFSSKPTAMLRYSRVMSTTTLKRDEEGLTHTAETPALKPWPRPAVVSNGDYRDEAFLENHIGGPLYSSQSTLSRLPVPTIEDTLQNFLPTALPLAKSGEEKQSLVQACRTFPLEAQELQRRLEERRDVHMHDSSWLQLWWNTTGYLQVRDPVVVNVSYFFHFKDDGTLPQQHQPHPDSKSKSLGVLRGASILFAAAEFRKMVGSGTLACDTIGKRDKKTPLCSVAFKYMFNACRIPKRNQDEYKMYDPSQHAHCIVARKGYFFAVDFCNDRTGDPLPLDLIEERLEECVQQADVMGDNDNVNLHLGYLTSSNRDSWADARKELLRVGGTKMHDELTKLESGALLLCLDDEEPESKRSCAELFWHGGLTSGHNRWFDKSCQICVSHNGKAGLLGEHSMMDGMPMVSFANHLTTRTYSDAHQRSSRNIPIASSARGGQVSRIFNNVKFDVEGSNVGAFVKKAKQDFTKLVMDHDLQVQSFHGYGSNFIKKSGFSPDAYVQMAIQIATYRLFGEQAGTYEATQVRPFLHGRTETTRSVSVASEAFVKKMSLRPKHDEHIAGERKEKLALLRDAVHNHMKYIATAAKAKGVDRHFFGLSMELKDGEAAPAIYSHPLFVRSKRWRVSTSHLSHPKFDNWGFGEVVPDGVGLAYAIQPECCVFNITALAKNRYTERLSHHLEEALLEMYSLIEMDMEPISKL